MSHLADQLKEQGNVAFRDGNYLEAEELYTQAVQKHSRNPLIFTNRANVRLKLQRWDGAVNDCLKSIEITGPNGQNHKAFYFLGGSALPLANFDIVHLRLDEMRSYTSHLCGQDSSLLIPPFNSTSTIGSAPPARGSVFRIDRLRASVTPIASSQNIAERSGNILAICSQMQES